MLTVTRMHAMSDLPDSQGFGLSPAAATECAAGPGRGPARPRRRRPGDAGEPRPEGPSGPCQLAQPAQKAWARGIIVWIWKQQARD